MCERGRLLRVGVDSNLHVSGAISALGNPRRLREAWRAGRFRLLISVEQRVEIEEALRQPRIARKHGLTEEDVQALLRRLDRDALRVRPARRLPVRVRDRDDEVALHLSRGARTSSRVPEPAADTDPVLVQLDRLLDDDELFGRVRADLAGRYRLTTRHCRHERLGRRAT